MAQFAWPSNSDGAVKNFLGPSRLGLRVCAMVARLAAGLAGLYDPQLAIVIGDPGVGKTTLLNGMTGADRATGLNFQGVTSWEEVTVQNGPRLANGKLLKVVDTPGLGGPKGKLSDWITNVFDVMQKQAKHVGAIIIIIDGITCRIGMASHIITQIIPNLINVDPHENPWDRICIVVSKCNLPDSPYQKHGVENLMKALLEGLVACKCPRVDKLDMKRDVIACGIKGEAPEHGNLVARLSMMMSDKGLPSYKHGAEAEKVVAEGLAEACGEWIDGHPVKAVAKNLVGSLNTGAEGNCCHECLGACVIA